MIKLTEILKLIIGYDFGKELFGSGKSLAKWFNSSYVGFYLITKELLSLKRQYPQLLDPEISTVYRVVNAGEFLFNWIIRKCRFL